MMYQFIGYSGSQAGRSIASAGDVDGDGLDDLFIGAHLADGGGTDSGEAYLVTAASLGAADSVDGVVDGIVLLGNIAGLSGSYRFVGINPWDRAAVAVNSAGDVDGDGRADLLIGADSADGGGFNSGEVYLIASAGLAAADTADGTTDGVIDLENIAAQTGSYRFLGMEPNDNAGFEFVSSGDVDGDGLSDIILGAMSADGGGGRSGEAYLVTAADLAAADLADFVLDGVIDLGNISGQPTSYRFLGAQVEDTFGIGNAIEGDVDGDGLNDVLLGTYWAEEAYLVNAAELAAADVADGAADGIIDAANIDAQKNSYRFVGTDGSRTGLFTSLTADVDGDGKADILISAPYGDSRRGEVFLVTSADLAAADAADGSADGVVNLGDVTGRGGGSYRFVGSLSADYTARVSSAGDIDGDGRDDLIIGAPKGDVGGYWAGEAYLVLAADLMAADAADGVVDDQIYLENIPGHSGSYSFIGDAERDEAGMWVSSVDDFDGDTRPDLLIGSVADKSYLISSADLIAADAADRTIDGVIDLGNVRLLPTAVAQNDAFATTEITALTGLNVFDDNGSGPDVDFGSALGVTMVNGVAADVGALIELDSGALLQLNADGTFFYDPNGQFEYIPLGVSDTDSFTYQLNGGTTPSAIGTVTITIDGIDNDDVFEGTPSDDVFDGGVGNDTFIGRGGDDVLAGGIGIDLVLEKADVDYAITMSMMTGNGSDSLDSIERARLIGGASDNVIDASGFTNGYVILEGRGGNDRLISPDATGEVGYLGSSSANKLTGGLGDDVLIGGTGTDVIYERRDGNFILGAGVLRGNGNDIFEGIEIAHFVGGRGNNTIDVSGFEGVATHLDGQEGNDRLIGGAAMDWVYASADADFVLTKTTLNGDGVDTLVEIDAARLTGGGGNNIFDVSASTMETVRLTGLGGDDTFIGRKDFMDWVVEEGDVDFSVSADRLVGLGTDTLVDIDGIRLFGGSSANTFDFSGFTGERAIAHLVGGNDTVIGHASGIDRVVVHGAHDMTLTDTQLVGAATVTLVEVEEAALLGSGTDDTLDASAFTKGLVRLVGGGGDDVLRGGSGNDELRGGSGQNSLFGGAGVDLVIGEGDVDMVLSDTQLLGIGVDTLDSIERGYLKGGVGDNRLDGTGFSGVALVLEGGGGDDTLVGRAAGRDIVRAVGDVDFELTDTRLDGLGADLLVDIDEARLVGFSGSNMFDASGFTSGPVQIRAGGGDDVLIGGSAADLLDGGDGADTFWFLDPTLAPDTLYFDPDTDVIHVDIDGFAGLPAGTLASDRFFATGAALSSGEPVFLYDQASGQLFFDADGNGTDDPLLFAVIFDAPVLTASNIMVDDFLI